MSLGATAALTSAIAFVGTLGVLILPGQAALLNLESFGYSRGSEIARVEPGEALSFLPDFFAATSGDLTISLESFDLTDPSEATFVLFDSAALLDSLTDDGGASAFGDEAAGTSAPGSDGIFQFLFENVLGDGVFAGYDGGAVLFEIAAPGLSLTNDIDTGEAVFVVTELEKIEPDDPDPTPSSVPLPASGLLLLGGLAALTRARRSS
ncbi:VPLPA-CTERM sorting domain-containing protein [Poseidonocella sedimentorum]|uniref:VPLPA-CTERM sorting domain-containing protein n=1 Tax=Poseidonocella sedimentorum TaxID=871652 RepID=UPI0011604EA0|nr:VPLPA-CTERM sorting domain-containing protein [Poseidonocella sedimentorum]